MKQVAILGTGMVGQTLAGGFVKHGYGVVMGTKRPEKELKWEIPTPPPVATYEKAARGADLIVLAVKGTVAEEVAKAIAPHVKGKTILDATNPIADAPTDDGVLRFFTTLEESLMERMQKLAPEGHFVKAFSCVGNAMMVNPDFGGVQPTMFICGNSQPAKDEASQILHQFDWEVEDMGSAPAARAIEPLCMSWCIPGFRQNQWTHAFKLLRK